MFHPLQPATGEKLTSISPAEGHFLSIHTYLTHSGHFIDTHKKWRRTSTSTQNTRNTRTRSFKRESEIALLLMW
jgi:hypothetical protein